MAPAGGDAGPSGERSGSKQASPSAGTMQDVSAAIVAAAAPPLERLAVADVTIAGRAAAIRELGREVGRLTAQVERRGTVHQDGRYGPGASSLAAGSPGPSSRGPRPPSDPFPAPLPPAPDRRDRPLVRRLPVVPAPAGVIAPAWPT